MRQGEERQYKSRSNLGLASTNEVFTVGDSFASGNALSTVTANYYNAANI
jgi:hypothetical protein